MDIIETIKVLFLGSGAQWVLWLLIALATMSLAIIVERAITFARKREDMAAIANVLDLHLERGTINDAIELLRPLQSVAARVALAGLRLAPRGANAAEKGMLSAIAAERKQLEARLGILGTLGNNAPFIGLLGTVIGIMLAFDELGKSGAASAGIASATASSAIMSAIAEALVATGVGIAVALPAVAAYNYFQRAIAILLDDAETLSNLVLAYLVSDDVHPERLRALFVRGSNKLNAEVS